MAKVPNKFSAAEMACNSSCEETLILRFRFVQLGFREPLPEGLAPIKAAFGQIGARAAGRSVPQGLLKIARSFNCGLSVKKNSAPPGRLMWACLLVQSSLRDLIGLVSPTRS